MKISVTGCGYLGAVHAATLASIGHTVAGIDVDPGKAVQRTPQDKTSDGADLTFRVVSAAAACPRTSAASGRRPAVRDSAGAHVTVTDPKAVNHAWRRYPRLRFEASTERALAGAELVLLLTEWDEYRRLSPAAAGALVRRRVVLDARNVLDAAAWQGHGWVVRGLGTGSPGRQAVEGALPRV